MERSEGMHDRELLAGEVEDYDDDGEQEEDTTVELQRAIDLRELVNRRPVTLEFPEKPHYQHKEQPYFEQSEVMKYLNPECLGINSDESEDDNDSDKTPFEKLALKMENVTDDGGVMKQIVQHGQGCLVSDGAIVTLHYNAYLEYADETFDSTRLRNRPLRARIGSYSILRGLEIGLQTMKKNEIAKFLLKPYYAYGAMGCPPRIPKHAVVLYEVEVIDFIDYGPAVEFQNMSLEEREGVGLTRVLAICKAEHQAGNFYFAKQDYRRAVNKYLKGIEILETTNRKNEEEEKPILHLLKKLYLNAALCRFKMNQPERAITMSNKVLEIDDNNVKALYSKGKAKAMFHEYRQASYFLQKANRLKPNDPDIKRELKDLEDRQQRELAREKLLCSRMLQTSNPANNDESATVVVPQNASEVDEQFKTIMKERLEEFLRDENLFEMPFPNTLNLIELDCLATAAEEVGLILKTVDVGNGSALKICKKRIHM